MDRITIKYPGVSQRGMDRNGKCAVETFDVASLADVSDGYHTIAELYDHRIALFIALCRMARKQYATPMHDDTSDIHTFDVWRSKFHSDGTPAYEGWFVLGIGKEDGHIITYHLPLSRWEETDFAPEIERAHFDGHTSNDVLERLKNL